MTTVPPAKNTQEDQHGRRQADRVARLGVGLGELLADVAADCRLHARAAGRAGRVEDVLRLLRGDVGRRDVANGTQDLDGDARTLAAAPDIGADELIALPLRGPSSPGTTEPSTDLLAPIVGAITITRSSSAGMHFTSTLSEASKLVFTIQRRTTGRKVRSRCRRPTRRNRKRKTCAVRAQRRHQAERRRRCERDPVQRQDAEAGPLPRDDRRGRQRVEESPGDLPDRPAMTTRGLTCPRLARLDPRPARRS